MPVVCRIVDRAELAKRPGDMYFVSAMVDGDYADWYRRHYLSAGPGARPTGGE